MCDSFLLWLSRKPALGYIWLSVKVLTEMSPARHSALLLVCSPVPAVCAALDSRRHGDQRHWWTLLLILQSPSCKTVLIRTNVGFPPIRLNNVATLIGSAFLCLGSGER